MRRDTGANWTSNNPILAEGEMGIELDTHRWKVGDGTSAWQDLIYSNEIFSGPSVIAGSGSATVLTVRQTGSGDAFIVEDQAATDPTPFVINNAGYVGIGTPTPLAPLDVDGAARFTGQVTSTVTTGTAPFVVASTTAVSNLNADMLDGQHGSYYTGYTDGYNATKLKIFNVKEYGAVGNWTNDDTAEIQAAIDAAAAVDGIVYIPSGTYKVTAPLVIPSWTAMEIRGGGWGTVIKAGDSAGLASVFVDNTATDERVHQVTLSNFAIHGNRANGNGSVKAIYICAHSCFIDKLFVEECYSGIDVAREDSMGTEYIGNNTITSTQVVRCDYQAFVLSSDSTLQHCGLGEIGVRTGYTEAATNCGVYVPGWDCRIIGNHFWGVNGPIVWANWQEHLIIANNVMERTYGNYIYIYGRSSYVNITGNVFEDKVATVGHDPLDWAGVPFIKIDPNASESKGLIISNNMFSEISGKARGLVISENANTDYGLYQGNWCSVAATTDFCNMLGANSIQANNMVKVIV